MPHMHRKLDNFIHLVYQFVICFKTARFITVSYKSLAQFHAKLLQTSRPGSVEFLRVTAENALGQ